MSSLMDFISEQIGSEQIEQIASRLGTSTEQAESAIGMALPTLLGAAARKADDDQGVAELHDAIQREDSSNYDSLTNMVSQAASGNAGIQAFGGGGNILGSLLGGRKEKVESGIGKASGLDGNQVGSLLGMLAPMVMGAIGKKSSNLDAGGLAGMLRSEKDSMEKQASGGLLAGLLDQDGDGDFDFSDVMQIGMKRLFGK